MVEPEERLRSRRAFIKTTLAGAAGALMAGMNKHVAYANTGAQQVEGHEPNLSQLGISEASQLVRSKKVSPVELCLVFKRLRVQHAACFGPPYGNHAVM
jgi:hypothetical protein